MILSLLKRLLQLFENALNFAKTLWVFVILLAGAVLVVVSIWLATGAEEKSTAILITATGSVLGTGVISLIWPRFAVEWQDAKRELLEKLAQAESEVARLMQTRIDVNSFRPILKLGLLETDAVIRDFYRKEIFRSSGKRWERMQIDEFLGVLTAKFKARLGVDLAGLRFREAGSDTLMVSGMKSEFQGFLNLKKTWDLAEIRVRKQGGPLPDDYQVTPNDSRLLTHRDEQEAILDKRINNGMEFAQFDAVIRRWAEDVIRALLSPLGKRILFVESQEQDAEALLDYLNSHNQKIETEIGAIQDRQHKLRAALDV